MLIAEASALGLPPWAGELLVFAIQILGPIILLLGSALVWKLLGKAGIEKSKSMDELLGKYLQRGVDAADAWAQKQADKPGGSDKMNRAVDTILPLLKAAGIKEMARDKLTELVEAKLIEEKKGGFHSADPR